MISPKSCMMKAFKNPRRSPSDMFLRSLSRILSSAFIKSKTSSTSASLDFSTSNGALTNTRVSFFPAAATRVKALSGKLTDEVQALARYYAVRVPCVALGRTSDKILCISLAALPPALTRTLQLAGSQRPSQRCGFGGRRRWGSHAAATSASGETQTPAERTSAAVKCGSCKRGDALFVMASPVHFWLCCCFNVDQ